MDELDNEVSVGLSVGLTRVVDGLVVFAELVIVEFPETMDRLVEEPVVFELRLELVLEMAAGFACLLARGT